METIGWIGSLLLAFCGAPAALEAFIKKESNVPYSLLVPWLAGEVLVLFYTFSKLGMGPLIWNYLINIFFILIMVYFKIKSKA